MKLYGQILFGAFVVLCASFAIGKQLVLDVDHADVRLNKKTIDANRLHEPSPGDAYAYDWQMEDFRPTKLCSLFESPQGFTVSPEKVVVSNIWGQGINETFFRMKPDREASIFGVFKVDPVTMELDFSKRHFATSEERTFRKECLTHVQQEVVKSGVTVYIVETVFETSASESETGSPRMVGIYFKPVRVDGCDTNCPTAVPMEKLLKTGFFTRFKANRNFVDHG